MSGDLEKKFKGYLLVNWKTGAMKVLTRMPKHTLPSEIPILIDLTIKIPQQPQIVAKGSITVPEHKVTEMILDAI